MNAPRGYNQIRMSAKKMIEKIKLCLYPSTNHVTIVNLSNFALQDYHVSLLANGMMFCLTPGELDMGELRKDLDRFHRSIRLRAFYEQLQNKGSKETTNQPQASPTPTLLPSINLRLIPKRKRGRPLKNKNPSTNVDSTSTTRPTPTPTQIPPPHPF